MALSVNKAMQDTSIAGPALVRLGPPFGGAFAMGWTGTDGVGLLNDARSFDGGATWKKSIIRSDSAVDGPALTEHNSKLFAAWTGTDGAGTLSVMSSTDGGQSFGKKHILDERSIAAPALTSYRGLLVIAWTGTDSRHRVNVATSSDEGATWTKLILPETSIAGPALTAYTSGAGFTHLFVAWTGADEGRHLNVRNCEGASFTQLKTPNFQKQTLSEQSNFGPALAVLDQGEGKDIFVAIAWTGRDTAQRLNVAYSLQGFAPFGFKRTSAETSRATPGVVTFTDFPKQADELVFAWTGTDPDGRLNFAPGAAIGLPR